jgi:hypothetical protein
MTEETPGQKMAQNARRLYEEGIETTKAWHAKLTWHGKMTQPQKQALLQKQPLDDHKRGATSPLGGDGWWNNGN